MDLAVWWPSLDRDGEEAVKYIHKQEKERYYMDLVVLATQYVQKATQLCIN